MVSTLSAIVIILFAIFTVADCTRTRRFAGRHQERFGKHVQIGAHNDEDADRESLVEGKLCKACEDGSTSAETDSAGNPIIPLGSSAALAQEGASQGSGFRPASNLRIRTTLAVVSIEAPIEGHTRQSVEAPPSLFSRTLGYLKSANQVSQVAIAKAACDSGAFSSEEIIQLAGSSSTLMTVPWHGTIAADLFAKGRDETGCISDPVNAGSIFDFYETKFPFESTNYSHWDGLKAAFIDNHELKPAKGVGSPRMQLHMGFRTAEDMDKLLGDLRELPLIQNAREEDPEGFCELGNRTMEEFVSLMSPMYSDFLRWLRRIGPDGEQFSGPQLVALVKAIPEFCTAPHLVATMLGQLEQHIMGVTCEEVKQIVTRVMPWIKRKEVLRGESREPFFSSALAALKPSIVDGQNKVDIIAFIDTLFFQRYPDYQWSIPLEAMVELAGHQLEDVGVGLPPRNNPVFGVVKGNPVILVVDESTSMDAAFTLGGNDTFTRRKFCNMQLEVALKGLPTGTYFNVVQYSSSAVTIFQQPVLVSEANINVAMEEIGAAWRENHVAGQDPIQMLRSMKVFALKLKHRLKQSSVRSSREALQLAYVTAYLPKYGQDTRRGDNGSHIGHAPVNSALLVNKGSPQIYFLTSGLPHGGASQITNSLGEFDQGQNIPVNSIAFITPADVAAKQFVKDMAHKTGGFFRSVEQPVLCTNKRRRQAMEVRQQQSKVQEVPEIDCGSQKKLRG